MTLKDWEAYRIPEGEEPDPEDLIQIREGVYRDAEGNIYMDTEILEERDRKLAEKQARDQAIWDEMNRRAAELSEQPYYKLSDIIHPEFMRRYSRLSSFRELLDSTGLSIQSIADLEACPDEVMDRAVRTHTDFLSWEALQDRALAEFYTRNIYGRPEDRICSAGDPSDPDNYGL
jgi:hypothetical protein